MRHFKYNKDTLKMDELTEEQANSLKPYNYFVYDKEKNAMVHLEFGGHFVGMIFLLRRFYGVSAFRNEDIPKYQSIIQENFKIGGAFYEDSLQYAHIVANDGDYILWRENDEFYKNQNKSN